MPNNVGITLMKKKKIFFFFSPPQKSYLLNDPCNYVGKLLITNEPLLCSS